MDDYNDFDRLKLEFNRYLNVARDVGLAADQAALGGFIALLAMRSQPVQLNHLPPHEIEPIVEASVQQFLKERLALSFDASGTYQIPTNHPALYRLLIESEFLILEEDSELLHLLDEMFPISASDGTSVTPECIADLMVRLLDIVQGQAVFDPCMGTGAFLRATQNYVRGEFRYTGADKNTFNLLVVKLKAYLSGQPSYEELSGSAFAFAHTLPQFDVVIGNPPIGKMPKTEARHRYFDALNGVVSQEMVLNFIELGLQHLKPEGRAAYLVPMGMLFSGGSAEEIRQSWLHRKLLKMVITLPAGLLHHTNLKCAILIFECTSECENVRFVLAEDCSERTRGNRHFLSCENASEVLNRSVSAANSNHVIDVSYEKIAEHSFILAPNEYLHTDTHINKNLSEKWEKIGDIAVVNQGTSLSRVRDGDFPVIRGKDLRTDRLDHDSLGKKDLGSHPKAIRCCEVNDVLLQRIGDNPAAYLVNEKDAGIAVEDTVFIIRFKSLKKDEIDFVCQFLNSDQVGSRISNARNYSVIPTQTLKSIRGLEAPIADTKIIDLVKEMNKLEASLNREHEKSREYKRALFDGDESGNLSERFEEALFMSSSLEASLKLKDDINYRVRTQYPFPIAYAYRNIYLEREYAGVYERQMKYGEQLLSFFAAIGISLSVKYCSEEYPEDVSKLLNDFNGYINKGISPGDIQANLQQSCKLLTYIESVDIAQDFSRIWYKSGGKKESAFAKDSREKLVSRLNAFKHHRGPANKHERKNGGKDQADVLESMLAHVEFCSKWDLIRIEEINKSWKSEDLEYSVSLLKGDHPAFEQIQFTSDQNLSKDKLYIKFGDDFICLYPLISLSYNENTRREEIFTIDRVLKNSFSLKSFESGTSIECKDLRADFEYWRGLYAHD